MGIGMRCVRPCLTPTSVRTYMAALGNAGYIAAQKASLLDSSQEVRETVVIYSQLLVLGRMPCAFAHHCYMLFDAT